MPKKTNKYRQLRRHAYQLACQNYYLGRIDCDKSFLPPKAPRAMVDALGAAVTEMLNEYDTAQSKAIAGAIMSLSIQGLSHSQHRTSEVWEKAVSRITPAFNNANLLSRARMLVWSMESGIKPDIHEYVIGSRLQ